MTTDAIGTPVVLLDEDGEPLASGLVARAAVPSPANCSEYLKVKLKHWKHILMYTISKMIRIIYNLATCEPFQHFSSFPSVDN